MGVPNIRIRIVIGAVLVITFALIGRIIYLSTIDPSNYIISEYGEYSVNRGNVYDKNGNLLAVSDLLKSVYVNPTEVTNKEYTAGILSKVLGIEKSTVYTKINNNKKFIWIKRLITPVQSQALSTYNLKGVYQKNEYKRFYPNRTLASHILGFCNIDNRGVEGIEKSMDSYLLSEIGRDENDGKHNNGMNVRLTIDSNIQAVAEYCLKTGSERENPDIASLIFIDGKSGEIIAMANWPDFDPNNYADYNQSVFRNASIFYQYEPGSVFKVFSLAPQIDQGYVDEETYFFCDGHYDFGGLRVKCTGRHGNINIAGVMKYSCNDGTLQATEQMPDQLLYNYLKAFGFGENSTILLPGEQPGLLRPVEKWTGRSKLSVPIGQEVSVNALQMVRALTVLTNDGIMIEPYIISQITDDDNNVIKEYSRREIRRVLQPGTSARVLNAMSETTMAGGTARRLKIEGINFYAKSGTAQIYNAAERKYSDTDVTSTLAVVFPTEKPRYIIYMVYHNPKGEIRWGGNICSRVLVEFITGIIGYTHINNEEEYTINSDEIKLDNDPERITTVPFEMPDFTGMSAGDVLNVMSRLNIKVKISGNGVVAKQSPAPGETVARNTVIYLQLK
ncbi:MAG: PASTA domain-containing protein [Spirochaetales bacterium]|nr:PASTA domain-containing protein [Spirochaetales bacterium]